MVSSTEKYLLNVHAGLSYHFEHANRSATVVDTDPQHVQPPALRQATHVADPDKST